VQVGTGPSKSSTYGTLDVGWLLSPSMFRWSFVSSEHGSTPSNRTSRGLAGRGADGAADGVPSTAVVHPAASTAVTSMSTVRTARR